MTPSFQFQAAPLDDTPCDLYVEILTQGMSFMVMQNNCCLSLVVCHFKEDTNTDLSAKYLHELITGQPILSQSFKRVHIIYGYPQTILVPHQLMQEESNQAILELVYGENNVVITRSDFIYQLSIHTVYNVPVMIDQAINRYFSMARHSHLFSLLPNLATQHPNQLYCIFGKQHLQVMLTREGKLQALQNFNFTTSEDVAYYLLQLCKSFDVEIDNTVVRLSGLIDEDSALFSELYKYFLQLTFCTLPAHYQYPEEIAQYPSHYFSHFFEIAACV